MDFENLMFAADVDRAHGHAISSSNSTELDILQQRTTTTTTTVNTTTRILRARRATISPPTFTLPTPPSTETDANTPAATTPINIISHVNNSQLPTSSPLPSPSASSAPSSAIIVDAEVNKTTPSVSTSPTKLNKDKRLMLPSPPAGIDITDFECALCMQVYHQPVTTSCGHVFCRQCIVRASKHCPNCPLCRHSLESKFAVNVVLMNVVEKYFPKEHQERVCENGEVEISPLVFHKATDEIQDEPQNTTWGCLIPSLRSTCTVFLSCGGF